MAESLRVVLTGSDGRPFAGGTVSWAISAGSGTASPASSTTDANGAAATRVSLTAAGGLTITASSGSVSPAAFTATAVPACQYVYPFDLGDVVSGALSTLDCAVNLGSIFYYDFYRLNFPAQQSFTVTLSSSIFDTWVDLFKATGELLGSNDDSLNLGGVTNSYFEGIFAAGNYEIGASSFDAVTTGAYTVRSAVRPPTIAQCATIWAAGPIAVTETIMTTDCLDASSGSTFYSDRLILALDAGVTFEARMASATVDPYLYLYDFVADQIVASNDDSTAGTSTAYLSYVVPQASLFLLDAGTAAAGQAGAYTLTLDNSSFVAGVSVGGGRTPAVRISLIPARSGGWDGLSARVPLRARLPVGVGTAPKQP